jgi:hypothetical protein
MTNPITTLLQAIGLKAKDVTLDTQVELGDAIGAQALGLFDAAADGLDHAATLSRNAAGKYEDLAEASRAQALDAEIAADSLRIKAAQREKQAASIRETFGLAA